MSIKHTLVALTATMFFSTAALAQSDTANPVDLNGTPATAAAPTDQGTPAATGTTHTKRAHTAKKHTKTKRKHKHHTKTTTATVIAANIRNNRNCG